MVESCLILCLSIFYCLHFRLLCLVSFAWILIKAFLFPSSSASLSSIHRHARDRGMDWLPDWLMNMRERKWNGMAKSNKSLVLFILIKINLWKCMFVDVSRKSNHLLSFVMAMTMAGINLQAIWGWLLS